MSRLRRLRALGALSIVVLLTGCGAPAAPTAPAPSSAASTAEPSAETPTDAGSAAPGKADVTPGEKSIVVTGSGNATVGPIALDQPFYVLKTSYTAKDEFSPLTVMFTTAEGSEVPLTSLFGTGSTARVFQAGARVPTAGLSLAIEANGDYTLEFVKPAALGVSVKAPQTFTGSGAGTTITGLVSTKGDFVMLGIKNTGAANGTNSGRPLAAATLYDVATGDEVVRNQAFYEDGTGEEDGFTADKPGTYFAIITAREGASWEVKISEG